MPSSKVTVFTTCDVSPWQLKINSSSFIHFHRTLPKLIKMSSTSSLCLGPKNSGKTHLLASLQTPGSITSVSHSVPTIGTNIFRIKLNGNKLAASTTAAKSTSSATCSKQKKVAAAASAARQSQFAKNTEVILLEIGGTMAPMWTNYLGNVSKIMYVVDTSNLCQISAAGEFECSTIFSRVRPFILSLPHNRDRHLAVHIAGRSTLTTHQNPSRSHQNGFGVSTNAQRSSAHTAIRKTEETNTSAD